MPGVALARVCRPRRGEGGHVLLFLAEISPDSGISLKSEPDRLAICAEIRPDGLAEAPSRLQKPHARRRRRHAVKEINTHHPTGNIRSPERARNRAKGAGLGCGLPSAFRRSGRGRDERGRTHRSHAGAIALDQPIGQDPKRDTLRGDDPRDRTAGRRCTIPQSSARPIRRGRRCRPSKEAGQAGATDAAFRRRRGPNQV